METDTLKTAKDAVTEDWFFEALLSWRIGIHCWRDASAYCPSDMLCSHPELGFGAMEFKRCFKVYDPTDFDRNGGLIVSKRRADEMVRDYRPRLDFTWYCFRASTGFAYWVPFEEVVKCRYEWYKRYQPRDGRDFVYYDEEHVYRVPGEKFTRFDFDYNALPSIAESDALGEKLYAEAKAKKAEAEYNPFA